MQALKELMYKIEIIYKYKKIPTQKNTNMFDFALRPQDFANATSRSFCFLLLGN
jgi:hypothetical protein